MEEVVLKDTLNAHWKSNVKSSFGFRMMQKMGWSEEKGLGKEENGITNYVKISKRDDGLGLGMDKFQDDNVGSKAWGSTISNYNSVLEVLKNAYKTNSINVNSQSSDNSSSDNDEKPKKKNKKEKKTQKSEEDSSDDEDVATPKSRTSSSPIKSVGIKYKKFRDSKLLANKSFEDKKAIFGHSSFASFPSIQSNTSLTSMVSQQSTSSEGKEKESEKNDDENDNEVIEEKKKSKKDKKNKKRKRSDKDEE